MTRCHEVGYIGVEESERFRELTRYTVINATENLSVKTGPIEGVLT